MSENKKNDSQNEQEVAKKVSSTPAEDLLKQVVTSEKDSDSEKVEEQKSKKDVKLSKEKKNHKKFKHGMMSTVLTLVFIVVIVLVNVVATTVFEKFPVTIDLTEGKKFSISDESKEYVKNINVDTLITVFAVEDDFTSLSTYTMQAIEVMKKYSQYNDKISYRFVEIDSNPDIVSEYEENTISKYDIIVETNPSEDVKRTRKITMMDLVNFTDDYTTEFLEPYQQYGYTEEALIQQAGGEVAFVSFCGNQGYVDASSADQAFMSAFMTVTDPNPTTVTFLTGRNEVSELDYLKSLLEANGYTLKTIDITKEEIPEDTNVAVVAAPKTDYLETEVEKLDNFLNNEGKLGKQLLYTGSLNQGKTPNLDEFLSEYGLEVGDGVICESSSDYYFQNADVTLTNDYGDKFTQDFDIDSPVLLNYSARPVNLLFSEEGQIATEAYVKSTDTGYVADPSTGDVLAKGVQNYVAVSSKVVFGDDGDANYSNVIVYGSIETLADEILQYSQFNNREYVISLLNGITYKTQGIVIEPKVIAGNVYDITDKQKTVLKVTFIAIIPVVVLIIGGVVWFRRKNR